MSFDLATLMVRRLCHDFAGPAGAIGTSLEMLSEAADPELVALAAESSAALVASLELYRYVMSSTAEPVGGGRAKRLVTQWLAARGDITAIWPDDEGPWASGLATLTAGLAMVAAEAAPRGTVLAVGEGVVIAPGTSLPVEVGRALSGYDATSTRAALAGVLAAQAAALGMIIDSGGDPLRLAVGYQASRLPR